MDVSDEDGSLELDISTGTSVVQYIGLMLVVTGVCVVMTVWEVASEVNRVWQGKGTLWRDIRK